MITAALKRVIQGLCIIIFAMVRFKTDRVKNKLHQDKASHVFNMAVRERKDLHIHLLFSNLAKPTEFIHSY